MASPQTADEVLDRSFLEVRSKLLDIASALDRADRADPSGSIQDDPRLEKVRESLDILQSRNFGRAERIQMVFSDEYDPAWNQ